MLANNNTNAAKSPSFKDRLLCFLQASAHAVILLAPIFYSSVLHNSDSMLKHAPAYHGDLDMTGNITEIGFSIRNFSTKGTEDISFSHEQQDAFGDNYTAAHATYHVLMALMWIALLYPLVIGLISKLVSCYENTRVVTCQEEGAKYARIYGKIVSPVLIVLSLLFVVPFAFLMNSSLCGPSYMELQFGIEDESSDSSSSSSSDESEDYYDDDRHHHEGCGGPDYEGTIAVFHEEIPATCTIGPSGIGFLCLTVIYPLVLIAHAYFLMRTANRLESEIASSERARENNIVESSSAAPVIKVHVPANDRDDDDDDDKTEEGSTTSEEDYDA
jgi:hypothetical protein